MVAAMSLSDPRLRQSREAHLSRLEALFAGQPLAHVFVLRGIVEKPAVDLYTAPERWVEVALDGLVARADESLDPVVFRPLVFEFGPYGVHFVDRIFGARVYRVGDQWWSDYLDTPVGELRPPDLARDDTWRLARTVAHAFLSHGVTVLLFGLPTIASALNIAVNLHGPDFLLAMLVQPDAARHDLRVIHELLCELHRWYQAHISPEQLQPVVAAGRCQPRGYGQLCGCSTHLLSAAMYRAFIAPFDDELLSVYEHGGMIHLCGVHTQHIPVWREMRSLRSIQLNDRAAEDLDIYFHELRDDQIIYLNPTSTMTIERALEITGGCRLVLVATVAEPLPLRNPTRPPSASRSTTCPSVVEPLPLRNPTH
ncbi:MAG: hypothetical protein HYY04_06995 [Chloroflexi bacterium]|nr:hypothetical protein [Chloroflexota bacterium]